MQRTQHPSNNAVLGAPPGMPFEQCRGLPITRIVYEDDGTNAVWSFWRPSAEELAALNAGALVRFEALGTTHGPIYIGVDGVPAPADSQGGEA